MCSSNCNKEWPRMDLILPVQLRNESNPMHWRNSEWEFTFYHSFLMFWQQDSKNLTLNLVIDEEFKNSTAVKKIEERLEYYHKHLQHQIPVKIHYNPLRMKAFDNGYDRQQYLMFTADDYSNSEYAAFLDTDAFIHSYVSYEDLFVNGKPVVHGYLQMYKNNEFGQILKNRAASTYKILQSSLPFMCMTYFPMIIKIKHLTELRKFIAQRYGKKEFSIKDFRITTYSQFCIFCTFMFWFVRDEYTWYLFDENPEWDGKDPPPVRGQFSDKHIFKNYLNTPNLFIGNHIRSRYYTNYSTLIHQLEELTVQALCWRNPVHEFKLLPNLSNLSLRVLDRYQDACSDVNYFDFDNYFHQMHVFERIYNFTRNDSFAMRTAHQHRRKRLQHCSQTIVFS